MKSGNEVLRSNINCSFTKIKGIFIRININVFVLGWLLLMKTKPFNLHLPAHNRCLRIFPGKLVKVLRIIDIMFKIMLIKRNHRNLDNDLISIPFDGHILLKKTGGYKVFNLKENIVSTQYDSNLKKDEFIKTVTALESIAYLGISPAIRHIDYKSHFIQEEYINRYKAEVFYPLTGYFYDKILPIWKGYIIAYPNKSINLVEYISCQEEFILASIIRLEKARYSQELISNLRDFIVTFVNDIKLISNQVDMSLSLSHGDLHAWNILLNKEGGLLIDWDTVEERSLTYDLFYMIFHNLFNRDEVDYNEVIYQLDKCMGLLSSNPLGKIQKHDCLFTKLNWDLYRSIFYLEYVRLYFENRINKCVDREGVQIAMKRLLNDLLVFKNVNIYKDREAK